MASPTPSRSCTKGRGEAESPANLNMNYFLGIDAATNTLVADFEDTAHRRQPPGHRHHRRSPVSVWHHAAVTYDTATDTWNLYLDGNLERTLAVGGNFTPETTSIQHAGLGTAMTSTGVAAGFFNGVLDEVRIWNVARSQAQIQAARDQELTSGTGLIARYGLNEGTGTAVGNSRRRRAHRHRRQRPDSGSTGFPLPDANPPAAPTGLAATPGNNLVGLVLDRQHRIRSGRLPRLPRHQPARRHDRQRPRRRGAHQRHQLHRHAPPSTAPPTTTSSSPSTPPPTARRPRATRQRHAVGRAPAPRSTSTASTTTSPSAGAGLGVTNFTIETWFRRDGAGVGATTGTRRHRDRHPARHQGRAARPRRRPTST